jgi:hypothetical protein
MLDLYSFNNIQASIFNMVSTGTEVLSGSLGVILEVYLMLCFFIGAVVVSSTLLYIASIFIYIVLRSAITVLVWFAEKLYILSIRAQKYLFSPALRPAEASRSFEAGEAYKDEIGWYVYIETPNGKCRVNLSNSPSSSPTPSVSDLAGVKVDPEMSLSVDKSISSDNHKLAEGALCFIGQTGASYGQATFVSVDGIDSYVTAWHVYDAVMLAVEAGKKVMMTSNKGSLPFTASTFKEDEFPLESNSSQLDLIALIDSKGNLSSRLGLKKMSCALNASGAARFYSGREMKMFNCQPYEFDDGKPFILAYEASTLSGDSGMPIIARGNKIIGFHVGAIHSRKINVAVQPFWLYDISPETDTSTTGYSAYSGSLDGGRTYSYKRNGKKKKIMAKGKLFKYLDTYEVVPLEEDEIESIWRANLTAEQRQIFDRSNPFSLETMDLDQDFQLAPTSTTSVPLAAISGKKTQKKSLKEPASSGQRGLGSSQAKSKRKRKPSSKRPLSGLVLQSGLGQTEVPQQSELPSPAKPETSRVVQVSMSKSKWKTFNHIVSRRKFQTISQGHLGLARAYAATFAKSFHGKPCEEEVQDFLEWLSVKLQEQ